MLSASSHTGHQSTLCPLRQSLLFLNPAVKSEDQSVLEPDAWYFISGILPFQQRVFCKVQGQALFVSALQTASPGSFSSRNFVNCELYV